MHIVRLPTIRALVASHQMSALVAGGGGPWPPDITSRAIRPGMGVLYRGGGGLGSQVNQLEQLSSLGHQILLAGCQGQGGVTV